MSGMRSILVTDALRGVGAVVGEAVVRLGLDVTSLPLPQGPPGQQAEAWLAHMQEANPEGLFVSHARLRSGGLSRRALDATESLFAAASRCESLERVVVLSSGQVYGASDAHPTFIPEEQAPPPGAGPSSSALLQVEHEAMQFARGRPDVVVTILRATDVLGTDPYGLLADHLAHAGALVTASLGYDPQVQFSTDHDMAKSVLFALSEDLPGVYNIAPDDALPLSECIRLLGKRRVGLTRTLTMLGNVLGRVEPWTAEMASLLEYGRALDSRRATEAGFPSHASTMAALRGWSRVARAAESLATPDADADHVLQSPLP